jgi:signal transduction histidine kinase
MCSFIFVWQAACSKTALHAVLSAPDVFNARQYLVEINLMKTSTRMILLLTVLIGLILVASGINRVRNREGILRQAMRNEMQAQALSLQIALESAFQAGRTQEAQQLIDSLSRNPKVYGVLIFDETGHVLMFSSSLAGSANLYRAQSGQTPQSTAPLEITHQLNSEEVFSIITPLALGQGRRGAFELAQPTKFINAEITRTRWEVALINLSVLATIVLSALLVLRYNLSRPIAALLKGAAALGRGDFNYRVPVPRQGSELTQLALEFNRMADSLAEQRKMAEYEAERRLQLERELRDHERLAAVGRLAAGVAHEIGTPLNVIDARAEQLLERPDAPLPARQRNLTIIRTQSERITRIVRQLLNLARPYQLKRKAIRAGDLLKGVVELIEADAERAQITLELTVEASVKFEIDEELIHQVLLNICRNALQAMPQGGRLQIVCAGNQLIKNGQPFTPISVRDTGRGIAPEHLAHIFEPFFTTKDVGDGTGLGLAVSRRIVEEHGGWIVAANRPTGGAEFSVFLPAAEMARARVGKSEDLPVQAKLMTYDESALINR